MFAKVYISTQFPRFLHEKPLVKSSESPGHFEKVIFPLLDQIKERMGYPKEQMSLVIMDTFKGQDNDELRKLCMSNNCEVVIVPHNLTNKFQPLYLSVNKAAKALISEKYNTRMTNEI